MKISAGVAENLNFTMALTHTAIHTAAARIVLPKLFIEVYESNQHYSRHFHTSDACAGFQPNTT